MTDKEQINDSLKNQSENFNENCTVQKNERVIVMNLSDIIKDKDATISRLQSECNEKSDMIFKLMEQLHQINLRKEQIIIDGEKYNKCNGCKLWDGYICIGDRSYEPNAEAHRAICNEHMAEEFWKVYHELFYKTQECEKLKEELNFLKNNEDLLISNLQVLWGKQIAEEQEDCKNIDYSKPRTKEIYYKITEIDRTLKDVAFAQSINIGKTKPLGDTGSPKSYKRWEARERKLLEREFLK